MVIVRFVLPLSEGNKNSKSNKKDLLDFLNKVCEEGLNLKEEVNSTTKTQAVTKLNPEVLRSVSDKVREQGRQNDKMIAEKALQAHIDYIVNNMFSAAEEGEYSIMSDNLCNQKYIEGLSWSLDEAENYLRKHLKRYFTEMGFSVEGEGNYVTISWEHKKTKK